MIDTIVLIQMILIGLCVFIQKTPERRIIAFIFALTIIGHDLFAHYVSDNLNFYYVSAGMLDLLVISVIASMKETTRLGSDIQLIALISIAYNFGGWTLHTAGQPVFVYNLMYTLLYGWALFTLIRGEPYVESLQRDSNKSPVRPDVCSGLTGNNS